MMTAVDRQQRIGTYRERLAGEPGSKVFAPLADLLRLEGEYDEALALLATGLELHPTYLTARVVQGRTLLDAGRSEEARGVLQSVLDDDGENIVVLRLLAEDALGRGAGGEAVPLLEALVTLDPEPEIWEEALAESRPAPVSRVTPRDESLEGPDFATMTLVDIYLAQGYRAKAETALGRILARDPGHGEAAERLAALAAEPEPAQGQAALDKVLAGEGDPAVRRRQKTARRSEDKKKFAEWIDRLRDEGSPTP